MESRQPLTEGALWHTLLGVAFRLFTRQSAFAIACVTILSAKLLHIYAHLNALQLHTILAWGWSFFFQDTIILLSFRLLLDQGFKALCVAFFVAALLLIMGSGSTAFYIITGTELRWKNIKAIHDPSAFKMFSTGIFMLLIVMVVLFFVSMLFQSVCFIVADTCIDVLWVPMRLVRQHFAKWEGKEIASGYDETRAYTLLSQDQSDIFEHELDLEMDRLVQNPSPLPQAPSLMVSLRLLVACGVALQVLCTIFRPPDSSLVFLSWTMPLMPIIHLMAGTTLSTVITLPIALQHVSALGKPRPFAWLPEKPHLGFEDWYRNMPHYDGSRDPLKTSNTNEELLPALQEIEIRNVSIEHVVLIELESTRKDVFPLKKNARIWERLASTYKDGQVPPEVERQVASLTPMARYLTGDLENGFINGDDIERNERPFRGGISAQNAHTTATYTLKSLLGTHCGVVPLAADFNREYAEHIYQPCLPHILNAMNDIKCGSQSNEGAKKWTSKFMQSTTLGYDHQDMLMPKLGFALENIVGGEFLKEEGHKFAPKNLDDVNYYGMPEVAIEDYLRDAFVTAKANDEHLFLSHLTSTSHHDFSIPKDEHIVELAGDGNWDMLSRYLNAIGYVDRWLAKVLDILEDEGVADETLVVLVGDHGLSIAEDMSFTPYHNPRIANFHVPLVVSHPALPKINITDPVTSMQILPTILDLLVETGTFSQCESTAARDLLNNYEGQSVLRLQKTTSDEDKHLGWQFAVMNPGGSSVAVRHTNEPNLHLIMPLEASSEWRFTDLSRDPWENEPIVSFDFNTMLSRLHNGVQQAWVKEAVQISKWWVAENRKRYRFKP
jgi:hypothetical protein